MQGKAAVLVLADQPLLGALLGLWIDVAGARAVFPANGEAPEATLEEAAPDAVMVDVEHPAALTDSFYHAAGRARVPVVLVGPRRLRERLHAASHRGARAFVLPEERTLLASAISAITNGGPKAG